METGGATYPYYHKHVQAIKEGCEHLDTISGNAAPRKQATPYRYNLFAVNVTSQISQVEPCTHPQLISTNSSE